MAPSQQSTCKDLLRRFNEDGFLGPIDVLNEEEVSRAQTEFKEWYSKRKATSSSRFKTHLVLPIANRIVHHPNLVSTLQNLLGTSNILCWSTDWNIKQPNSPHFFAPHQDSTYAGLDPPASVVTVWVAISDPVTEHEGCLSFWKGSHKLGQIPHERESSASSVNMLALQQRCLAPDGDPIAIPLRAGQATIHSFRTIHSSGPNRSIDHMRVGFAIRYMAASVRQVGTAQESATLVSGRTEHEGFLLEPILPKNPDPVDVGKGRAAQMDAIKRESENYFSK